MGLSVSQGHFGGLIREHGLIRGYGLIRRHQVVPLKSIKEVRSTLLKTTVQTKTTDDFAEMDEKNPNVHVLRTWYGQESIIYGLSV